MKLSPEEDKPSLYSWEILSHLPSGSLYHVIEEAMMARKLGQKIEVLPDCDIAVISGDCGASSWAYQLRKLETDRAFLDRVIPLIPKDTIVIDAGAFIGSHTAEYVKHSPEVWSFEPNPTAFACLSYNCPTAKLQRMALGEKEGELYWNMVYPNCGGSFIIPYQTEDTIAVPVIPLDSLKFKRRIGYIKIDVEGMECKLLLGAASTLKIHRPNLCIEVNTQALRRNHATPQGLFDLLDDMGYHVEPMWPGQDEDYKKNFKDHPEDGFQWDILAIPKEKKPVDVVGEFHKKYYSSCVWVTDTKWRGVSVQKSPNDLWVYQEIINEIKPELIIETGTCFGGGAFFLGDMCDFNGNGYVISIDTNNRNPPWHRRVKYINSSSIAPDLIESFTKLSNKAVMVILDSDHSKDYVLKEMEAYAPLVTVGSYMIVEDSNVNGHPVCPDHGPGPMEAIWEFLSKHPEFVVDKSREKFLMTQNPNGYLRKIK